MSGPSGGIDLDRRRATRVLLRGDPARLRRVRLFLDYLRDALMERRADVIGA